MRTIILDVPDGVTDEKAQYELNRIFSPDWASLQELKYRHEIMKTMIVSIEVPEWVEKDVVQSVLDQAFSPDWISIECHISDVQDCAGEPPMSDEDARGILDKIHGATWDTIHHHVELWREHQEVDNG